MTLSDASTCEIDLSMISSIVNKNFCNQNISLFTNLEPLSPANISDEYDKSNSENESSKSNESVDKKVTKQDKEKRLKRIMLKGSDNDSDNEGSMNLKKSLVLTLQTFILLIQIYIYSLFKSEELHSFMAIFTRFIAK